MKKYLLVSLTILFAAAFVWAEEATPATPSVDVEADATLSWGLDLGTGDINATHGFKNEASFAVKFPLINKGGKTSTKSDVPVYGEVSLKDIELKLLSEKGDNAFHLAGQVKDIEAKLVFYGAYLTVFDAPDFHANYAQIWKPLENDKEYKASAYRYKPGFDGAGAKLGYTNKNFMDLDVGLKVGSNGPWNPGEYSKENSWTSYWKYFDGKTAVGSDEYVGNYEKGEFPPEGNYFVSKQIKADPKTAGKTKPSSKYGIGVDFSVKPLDKMLELAFTVNSTLSKEYADADLNFGVEVKSEPIDGLKLKAGFDGGLPYADGAKFGWDTLASAEYKWVSGGVYVYSPDSVKNQFWTEEGGYYTSVNPYALSGYSFKDNKAITDVAFFLQFATKADKKEASNLVEGLDAGAYVGIYNMLTFANKGDNVKMQFPLLLKLWGSYKLNLNDSSWLKPFASMWVETNYGLMSVSPKQAGNKSAVPPIPDHYFFTMGDPSVGVAYNLGVTYSPVEKVEVTAKWSHGKTHKNYYRSAVKQSAFGTGHHNGEFVLSLKLTY